jgi:hypothetical protein
MLLSVLALLPLLGPVLLRLLRAWVFVTVIAALRAILGLDPRTAVAVAVVGLVAAVAAG